LHKNGLLLKKRGRLLEGYWEHFAAGIHLSE